MSKHLFLIALFTFLLHFSCVTSKDVTGSDLKDIRLYTMQARPSLLPGHNHIQPLHEYLEEKTIILYFDRLLRTSEKSDEKPYTIPWHPDTAPVFIVFLTNTENQLEFCNLPDILPSNKKTLKDEYIQIDNGTLESQARILDAEQLFYRACLIPQTSPIDLMADHLNDALHFAFTGHQLPDKALKMAYNNCNKYENRSSI